MQFSAAVEGPRCAPAPSARRFWLAAAVSVLALTGPELGAAPPGSREAADVAPLDRLTEHQWRALSAMKTVDPGLAVAWDTRELVPRSLAGRLTAPSSSPAERIALDFLRTYQDLFRVSDVDAELAASAPERDALDMTHLRFRQRHLGLPVFGGELRVHVDASGVVTSAEAELVPAPVVSAAPLLGPDDAAKAAVAHLGAGRAREAASLVVIDPGRITGGKRDERLAWHVELVGPDGEWVSFVDAVGGEVVYSYRNTHEARDRRVHSHDQSECSLGAQLYNEGGPLVPNPPADATKAYDFTGDTYNYFLTTHGRDSYDGAGAPMSAAVQWSAANAQWSPTCRRTRFGLAWATKDVVAHEWQHGVTQFTADLIYSCESGALNESMSDVFGAMVDRDDWLMGEDLLNGYIRSLSDPGASRPPQPDTNTGANPCAGVHHNSGIPNKVAYLVSEGGVHYGVSVAGQGRAVTERVWYRALRFHLGASTKCAGARDATINAATELYGAGSAAVCSVTNAWASVAVGPACAPPANDAVFVSQSVPTSMTAGQQYSVSVTLRNTGGTVWTSAAGYKLGSQNPQDNQTWGFGRVALPASVSPGGQVTFNFSVTAPSAAGNYNFQWRMLRELVQWFGAYTPNVVVSVQAPAINNAAFVSQSVPTTMVAGKTYNVSVTMKNTGTTTWTSAAGYKLGSQNPQDNGTWGFHRVPLGANVAPGANHTFNFTVTAPAALGSHNFQWRMLREGVAWFGAFTPNVVVGTVLAAPSGLTASYNSSSARIQLSWTDTNGAEQGTHLQFSYSGSAWSDLSPATVGPNVTTWQSGPNPPSGPYDFRVRAFQGTVYSGWSNVASLLVPPPGTPEISVTQAWDGVAIPDGGSFAYPTTPVASLPISRLFNVCNEGTGTLTVTNPGGLVGGTGFSEIVSPAASVAPGSCTSFRVRFHVATPGSYTGAVTIQNNDGNENPYNIALSGTATP